MTDFETHPADTTARIAERESANGVHIPRTLSNQEMVEVEKMATDGKFQEAAQKFGGHVTYPQAPHDLPPMTNVELVLHLRGGLVPVSVAHRAASRIEQLEADNDMMFAKGISHGQQVLKDTGRLVIVDGPELVELREAITRANAATAAAYEVAAQAVAEAHVFADDDTDGETAAKVIALGRAGKAIRALATPDQTAALDKMIAEAEARVWEKAADIARHAVEVTGHRMREAKEKKNKKEERDWQSMLFCAVDIRTAILAASKKGGV